MYKKDFDKWNTEKKYIDTLNHHPYFAEREIWWCSFGVNVGVEVDGKNGKFERPALILKYINKDMTLLIPLTTKERNDKNHIKIENDGMISFAKISQMRVVSSKRLIRKIGMLPEQYFKEVKRRFLEFVS